MSPQHDDYDQVPQAEERVPAQQAPPKSYTRAESPRRQERAARQNTSPLQKSTMKRKGSKFDLQDNQAAVLYRPEFKYDQSKRGTEKMWELMGSYLGTDVKSIQR